MFKSRMRSTVLMLMAVALTASVSVSAATAVEPTTAPVPAPTFTPASPETDESGIESTDFFVCEPYTDDGSETGTEEERDKKWPCK